MSVRFSLEIFHCILSSTTVYYMRINADINLYANPAGT